jgi:peptidoglycan/xylan/chitin deacetylase (PgdA/CDA1 family)
LVVLIIISAAIVYFGIPWIYKKYAQYVLKNKTATSRSVVLTFDDGPSDRMTPAVIDLLDQYNIKASFFLLGRNIAGRENIVRQIAESGHEICSHGFEHIDYCKVTPWRALRDIKQGWSAIDSAMGTNRDKYPFRPPYGRLNIICLLYLLLKKVPIIYWTDDSGDTWKIKPENDRIAKQIENSHGGITLFHDFNRGTQKKESWVLESVHLALLRAKEKRMNVVTILEII